ncbi:MAG: DUF2339 domain-containing protein [Myxococcaceae bacterium]|jgi:uncharacterized membrane protein|nr:DUF2339 domain-containing protein [Myxococcaceae bacterium]
MSASPSLDTRVLQLAGLGLLTLAAIFGWQELELQGVFLAILASGVATVVSTRRLDGVMRWVAPSLLLVTAGVSGLAWLAFKLPLLLLGVLLPVLGAGWVAVRLWRAREAVVPGPLRELPLRAPEFLTWQTLGAGLMTLTGGLYFHLMTTQVDDLARRLVLTLAWTVLGLGLVVMGRTTNDTAPRDAGFVVLGAAVLKAALYDTTHLFGGLRIGVLVAVGALLLLGAKGLERLSGPRAEVR